MGHFDTAMVTIRTILGSPDPSEPGSVLMEMEFCDDNAGVIIKGIDPLEALEDQQVLKTLDCDEVDQLLELADVIAGAAES